MEEKHFICMGGCKGVSDKSGLCQDENCEHRGMPLEECDCFDGEHKGAFEDYEEDEEKRA